MYLLILSSTALVEFCATDEIATKFLFWKNQDKKNVSMYDILTSVSCFIFLIDLSAAVDLVLALVAGPDLVLVLADLALAAFAVELQDLEFCS